MDFVEAARIRAMLDVMDGGFLYQYRRICRWFSQKFYTPLPQVLELDEEIVLQAFFESQFEEMGKGARRKLAIEMTETEEETKERKKKEADASDEAFLKKQEKEARKESKKAIKKLEEQAKAAAQKLAAIADKEIVAPAKEEPKPKKKAKTPPQPEISMSFDSNGNLLDEECIPAPPPRKR